MTRFIEVTHTGIKVLVNVARIARVIDNPDGCTLVLNERAAFMPDTPVRGGNVTFRIDESYASVVAKVRGRS